MTFEDPIDRTKRGNRLDAMTRAKVDDLATRFHRPRGVVLSYIMDGA